MSSGVSARAALRAGTADLHDRVDQAFSHANLSDRAGYTRFLIAQAAAHIAVERALTRDGAGEVLPDWPERRREALLEADLAALGADMPDTAGTVAFDTRAAALGGVYVLEGSRLGGTMLKRIVPPALPRAFLGARYAGGWPRLLALLDAHLADADAQSIAINAAREVFMLFERAAQRYLGMQHVGG